MTLSLLAYSAATWIFAPLAGYVIKKRLRAGKERENRVQERFGRTTKPRPTGQLIWMHGASVGETAMLLSIFNKLQTPEEEYTLLITSQTLTSADMIATKSGSKIIHQMAPIDTRGAVKNFLSHWQPDIAIFAEGEIWPNLITATKKRNIPLNLVNARMTTKTINGWKKRFTTAQNIFNTFNFIGAADQQTTEGLEDILGRKIDTTGNLKRAIEPPSCNSDELESWETSLANRECFLAASTHEGEEEIILSAFQNILAENENAFLILAPRHPERAPEIIKAIKNTEIDFEQRSKYPLQTSCSAPILLADTIGEMGLWMQLSQAIYLGGANKENIGGHNPIEPLKLRKPVFTGPHSFNFSDLMVSLEPSNAIIVGNDSKALTSFWKNILKINNDVHLHSAIDWASVDLVFSAVDEPLALTLNAIKAQLEE